MPRQFEVGVTAFCTDFCRSAAMMIIMRSTTLYALR